jgi:hypothetical protein
MSMSSSSSRSPGAGVRPQHASGHWRAPGGRGDERNERLRDIPILQHQPGMLRPRAGPDPQRYWHASAHARSEPQLHRYASASPGCDHACCGSRHWRRHHSGRRGRGCGSGVWLSPRGRPAVRAGGQGSPRRPADIWLHWERPNGRHCNFNEPAVHRVGSRKQRWVRLNPLIGLLKTHERRHCCVGLVMARHMSEHERMHRHHARCAGAEINLPNGRMRSQHQIATLHEQHPPVRGRDR